MAHYNFKKDLVVAKKTEIAVAKLLESHGIEHIRVYSNSDFDLIGVNAAGIVSRYEVKEDFMVEQTGNVALEFECRGKPSGISISKSEYHIYVLHTKRFGIRYAIINTWRLKRMVEDKLYFRVISGGDKESFTLNYLFKYDVFVKHARYLIPKSLDTGE
jgi:hypothetical protein